ncbi:hypothetical protein V2J09_008075 [Rumex salicifolius]
MDAAVASANDVIVSITAAQQVLNTTEVATSSEHDASNGEEGFGIKLPGPQRSIRIDTQLSPNITKMSPASTPGKPPKTPIRYPSRKQSLSRSSFSKPKSRLIEASYPTDMSTLEENVPILGASSPAKASPRANLSTPKASTPITPKTPLMAAQGGDDEDEKDDEIYKAFDVQQSKKGKKVNVSKLIEWAALLVLVTFLIASTNVNSLRHVRLWSLELWKWCVLVMVVFCGRLLNEWITNFLVFVIERNFWFKKKVLYFVYGMKKSVQYFFWLGFILLAWELLFNHGVERSSNTNDILEKITMAIAGCLVGSGLWLIKTLLIKILAVSFHVNRFFDRIQESLFHQYILLTLSGPPQMEIAEHAGMMKNSGRMSFIRVEEGEKKQKEEVIDVEKLHKLDQGKVSAWTMKGLIQVVRSTGLTTISNTLDDDNDDDGSTQTSKEITSEWEAKVEAYKIFKNVAKPGHTYIEEEDLLRFMKKEEADNVLPLFEGATETGKIKRSALTKWVVNAYLDRKSLSHSLHDTKTAVEELNKMASVFVAIVIIIVWNLMMGFLTTKVLVLISSQLLLIVFMFGNTAKTIFEAIVFVFIMHPYDVGDRCVIDGVQMIVEEMNILTTIFLRYDNEKIIYPNSVLATKPISNFYRSPEMSDSIEFAIDFSTTMETISALKARIKLYIDSKPQHWKQGHSLQVKEIENMDKMKMALYVNHTINFQNAGEKGSRKCDLMWELKKIFEDLEINYHLLPQEVHVTYSVHDRVSLYRRGFWSSMRWEHALCNKHTLVSSIAKYLHPHFTHQNILFCMGPNKMAPAIGDDKIKSIPEFRRGRRPQVNEV